MKLSEARNLLFGTSASGGSSGSGGTIKLSDAKNLLFSQKSSGLVDFNDDQKSYISKKFQSSWDYDDRDPEDLQRKAQGIAPKAVEASYTDASEDHYLKSIGLPAYKDLEKYLEDYNAYADSTNTVNGFKQDLFASVTPDATGAVDVSALDTAAAALLQQDKYASLRGKVALERPDSDDYDNAIATANASFKQNDTLYVRDWIDEYEKERLAQTSQIARRIDRQTGKAVKQDANVAERLEASGLTLNNGFVAPEGASDYFSKQADSAANTGETVKDKLAKLSDSERKDVIDNLDTSKYANLPAEARSGMALRDALGVGKKDEATIAAEAEQKAKSETADNFLKESTLGKALQDANSIKNALGDNLGAARKQAYDENIDSFRAEAKASGLSDFEIDNALRRANLDYLDTEQSLKNYVFSQWKSASPDATDADMESAYSAIPTGERSLFAADMAFDPGVNTTFSDQMIKTAVSMPIRATLSILQGVTGVADMLAGELLPELIQPVVQQITNESSNWQSFGSDSHHKVISVVGDIGTEVLRMYATWGAGAAVGTASAGMGAVLSKFLQATPFMLTATGNYFVDAMQSGASRSDAATYAVIAGVIEGATEALSADAIFGKTWGTKAINAMVNSSSNLIASVGKIAGTTAGKATLDALVASVTNGIQEGASYVLTGIAQRAIYNPEWAFDKSEFWSNVGMGAAIGLVGSAMSGMSIESQEYKTVVEKIASGDMQALDDLVIHQEVLALPPAKVAARIVDAQMLTKDEYADAKSEVYKSTQMIQNAESAYNERLSAIDAEVNKKQKAYEALKNQLANTTDIVKAGQISEQIASARRELAQAKSSATSKRLQAENEYKSVVSNNTKMRDAAQRRVDDHNIAYDADMQVRLARYEIESTMSKLESIDSQLVELQRRMESEQDVSALAALEDNYGALVEEAELLRNALDEAVRTEEWMQMENVQSRQKWESEKPERDVLFAKASFIANKTLYPNTDSMQYGRFPNKPQSVSTTGTPNTVTAAVETATAPEQAATVQPANGQVEGIVSQDLQNAATGLKRIGQTAYNYFVSGQAELERASKVQRKLNSGAVTLEDSVQQVRNAGGIVDYIMDGALVDKDARPVAASYSELVKQIPKEQEADFNTYMQHRHNIDRMSLEDRGHGKNKAVLDSGVVDPNGDAVPVTAIESEAKVFAYEQAHPEYKQVAAQIDAWWDTFMRKWMVDGGLLSEDAYDTMRDMYPHYIPTFRETQDTSQSSSAGYGQTIGTAKTIKSAKGSASAVRDLRDTFAEQINKMVRAERKNELFLNLYNFAETHPEIAAQYAAITAASGGTALDYDTLEASALDDIERDSVKEVRKGVYEVSGFKDGKRVTLNVTQNVFDALNDLYFRSFGKAWDSITGGMRKITNVPKSLITGLNPFFAITNIARDVQTGYVNSVVDNPVKFVAALADAGKQMAEGSERWKSYLAMGGRRSGFYKNESGFVESSSTNQSVFKKVVEKGKDSLSWLGENSEAITRFAEYNNYLNQNGDTPDNRRKAILAAADVTVNFSRSAQATKFMDSFVLYLNANVQGLDKFARQVKNKPVATLAKNIPGVAIIAALLKLAGNEDNPHYQNINNYTKDSFFLIPNVLGERDESGYPTTFIKIPKAREYGFLLALVERVARVVDGEAPESAFKDFTDTALTNFIPQNPFTDNVAAPLIATGAFGMTATNKDYAGRDIIPQYMQEENPLDQKTAQTSDIAVRGAEIISMLTGKEYSPMYVDYLINQYGGFTGDTLTSLTAGDAGGLGSAIANVAESKFIADPLYASGAISDFYDKLDEAKYAAEDAKALRKQYGNSIKTIQEKEYDALNKAKSKIADLRKKERKLLADEKDTPSRKEKIDSIRREMNQIAQEALSKKGG